MKTPVTGGTATPPRETEAERAARLANAHREATASIRRMRLKAYRRREETERYDRLLEAVADWEQAGRLRAFLGATELRLADGVPAPLHATEWLAWAWAKAEALDPLAPTAELRRFMRVKRRRNVPDHELPEFSIFDLR
ncbi:hypothetical protein [Brevundimonas sp. EAKA]|uniref:hypothetical protein n=1 Tax=Brevundimonas sp. EAKA TaxID=1495854 RepID=UPI0012DCE01A|nr:hypothetical protein [Brevundimonas sp. EAKA]